MKNFLALLMILCMCFCFVSCENKTNTKKTDNNETKTESETKQNASETALVMKASGNYEEAIKGFLKVIDTTPEEPRSYLELADIYIRLGQIPDAYEILLEGLRVTNSFDIENKLLEFNVANSITDSDNIVRGRSYTDENNTLHWYHLYDFNEKGKSTRISLYDSQSNKLDSLDFEYGANGLPTVYYSYLKDGTLGKLEIEHNESGQVSKITEYESGSNTISGYTYIEYAENGYKSKETNVNADNSPHWEYTYYHSGEKAGTFDISFFGKIIGGGEFHIDDNGVLEFGARRTQGHVDIDIDYDCDYEGNTERVEISNEMDQNVRTVCYGTPYYPEED